MDKIYVREIEFNNVLLFTSAKIVWTRLILIFFSHVILFFKYSRFLFFVSLPLGVLFHGGLKFRISMG